MKLVVDTHTHTLSSGHAYSTICENAIEGAKNGIEAIAMTDHGPAMEGATSRLHFWNLNVIPDYINGVRIIKGAEANITDHSGKSCKYRKDCWERWNLRLQAFILT